MKRPDIIRLFLCVFLWLSAAVSAEVLVGPEVSQSAQEVLSHKNGMIVGKHGIVQIGRITEAEMLEGPFQRMDEKVNLDEVIKNGSPMQQPAYPLAPEERDLVAAVVFYEARGEGPNGMAAVADTILNRLLDGRFGATVTEVCTPDQFCGLNNIGTLEVFQPAYNAVDLVFSQGSTGWTLGALYFCTPTTNPDRIKPGLRKTMQIGNHVFYSDLPEDFG